MATLASDLTLPEIPVIMISGHGDINTAVDCLKKGAFDYLPKPPDLNRLLSTVRHALEKKTLVQEVKTLKKKVSKKYTMIGESSGMMELRGLIEKVAPSEARVLITGPNGSGKELVAHQIHQQSARSKNAMVEVNCAAIPSELIESELFGHKKGAFTGAQKDRKGKFELAHGGTLFLDEIGDMSLSAQAKVLRALQEHQITPVGGDRTIKVNVRVLAATNKDLRKEIEAGKFREDLYHRLSVILIEVPGLNDRRDDIPLLAVGFIVNKVARPFYSEAIKLYEEGVASVAEIDAAIKSIGFRMGPFELTDLIGHDVNYTVTETVWSQFFYDPRFRPSITQKRLKEAGLFGRKTGRGFYNYASGMDAAVVAQEEVEIDPMLSEKIVERILCLIINEALDAVWQGIASPENVDLAMTKGVNYPKGPIQWGREMGWDQVLGTLKRCHKHYGDDRYRPCPLLRHLNTGNAELGEGQLTDNFMV